MMQLFVKHHVKMMGFITRTVTSARLEQHHRQKSREDCCGGDLKEALHILKNSQNEQGIWVEPTKYGRILQSCAGLDALEVGQQVHANIIKYGFEEDMFVGNNVANMYAKCRQIGDARQVFDKMLERDVVSWTAMIGGYVQNGNGDEALKLYFQMKHEGVMPNQFTFATVLQACGVQEVIEQGKNLHAQITKSGFESNVVLCSNLIDMYIRCGSLENARQVFDKMPDRDVVTWTAMIGCYNQDTDNKEALNVFSRMQEGGIQPNEFTLASVLRACTGIQALQCGQQVHAIAIESGLEWNVVVRSVLVDMYTKCGSLLDASKIFDMSPKIDVVLWTAMIAGYVQTGHGEEGLKLFRQMRQSMDPNLITFASVLRACCSLTSLERGVQVHAHIIKIGIEMDISIGNLLVDMYAKCACLKDAICSFNEMPRKDVVSWTTMIAGHVQNEQPEEAVQLFHEMLWIGIIPNLVTFTCLLRALANLGTLKVGKQVHAHLIRTEFEMGIALENALLDMYAKCGNLEYANILFGKMLEKDVITWTIMVLGNSQNGHGEEALKLFTKMQQAGLMPDMFSFATVLSVCASLALLQASKQLHSYIIKTGFELDVSVGNALLDMYAKCGSLEDASAVFDKMSERNVVTWNAMIAGLAHYGCGDEALGLFQQMQEIGTKPDHITFIVVLYSCSHVGLVDQGCRYFESMYCYHGIIPSLDHYVCMVDLLGRAGNLDQANDLINAMPFQPNALVYKTLLSACRIHGNIELGKHAAECIIKLESDDAASYVLLSNIYAEAGSWDYVSAVRKIMKDRGVTKKPGHSWIEVRNKIHVFVAGDRSHPQTDDIYAKVLCLTMQMKEVGYVPNASSVSHDLDQEQKEQILCHHSEKLAIAFGLINTTSGTTIRIFKNLRVCDDCHTATKFLSKIVQRQIVVRDANRFHLFKEGLCSCADYW